MSTYTDIRYDYNLPSGYGGSLQLISEQTASSSASISFTSGIDSTYRTYLFKFINIHPSTDQTSLNVNFSTDGGSNYNVTKTTTVFFSYHNEIGTSGLLQYRTADDLAQSTSDQQILYEMGNDNDQSGSGEMYLFQPSSNTFVKHFIATGQLSLSSDYSLEQFTAGYANTVSACNAVIFRMSSGNIDSGTIKMYGIA